MGPCRRGCTPRPARKGSKHGRPAKGDVAWHRCQRAAPHRPRVHDNTSSSAGCPEIARVLPNKQHTCCGSAASPARNSTYAFVAALGAACAERSTPHSCGREHGGAAGGGVGSRRLRRPPLTAHPTAAHCCPLPRANHYSPPHSPRAGAAPRPRPAAALPARPPGAPGPARSSGWRRRRRRLCSGAVGESGGRGRGRGVSREGCERDEERGKQGGPDQASPEQPHRLRREHTRRQLNSPSDRSLTKGVQEEGILRDVALEGLPAASTVVTQQAPTVTTNLAAPRRPGSGGRRQA